MSHNKTPQHRTNPQYDRFRLEIVISKKHYFLKLTRGDDTRQPVYIASHFCLDSTELMTYIEAWSKMARGIYPETVLPKINYKNHMRRIKYVGKNH